jgi:hypothetical protein
MPLDRFATCGVCDVGEDEKEEGEKYDIEGGGMTVT